jgi:hypothetical protein
MALRDQASKSLAFNMNYAPQRFSSFGHPLVEFSTRDGCYWEPGRATEGRPGSVPNTNPDPLEKPDVGEIFMRWLARMDAARTNTAVFPLAKKCPQRRANIEQTKRLDLAQLVEIYDHLLCGKMLIEICDKAE